MNRHRESAPVILLTVDVEDWFQVENFKSSIARSTWKQQELRVAQNCHRLMSLFDDAAKGRVQATFFVLGWVARRLPGLVREIASQGHEVASHGMGHELCTTLSAHGLLQDLERSRKCLEDMIGKPVKGYRAPSFAINDIILGFIEKSGYRYDSSFNSFDRHGRYGSITTRGKQKKGVALEISPGFFELPVSNLCFGRAWIFPLGGGGYFRLLPSLPWHRGMARVLDRDGAYLFYMHPWEVDPGQPRVSQAPAMFRFRHYVNLKRTAPRLNVMIQKFSHCRFMGCSQYLETVSTDRR